MKIYKTSSKKRDTYTYTFTGIDGKEEKIVLRPGENGVTEADIKTLHEKLDKAVVLNNTVTFHFKDGSTKTLDYKEKKKGTPHTEEYKEYMRECMKQIWDDERRKKMSQKMKKLRTERGDKWQKEK